MKNILIRLIIFIGVIKGLPLCRNEFGYLFSPYLENKFGFNSFKRLNKRKDKVASYIVSYVSKAPISLNGNYIYRSSRGLNNRKTYNVTNAMYKFYETNGVMLSDGLDVEFENDFIIKFKTSKENIDYILNI